MKSIKLNGWQRLWVVFSSLLFIPAVLLTVSSLPGNKEVMDDLEIQLREKGALDLFEILSVENLLNGKSVKDSEKEFNSTPDKTKIVLDEANIQRLYNEVKTKKAPIPEIPNASAHYMVQGAGAPSLCCLGINGFYPI